MSVERTFFDLKACNEIIAAVQHELPAIHEKQRIGREKMEAQERETQQIMEQKVQESERGSYLEQTALWMWMSDECQ